MASWEIVVEERRHFLTDRYRWGLFAPEGETPIRTGFGETKSQCELDALEVAEKALRLSVEDLESIQFVDASRPRRKQAAS